MKFGTSYEEIKKEPAGGGGGSFIKYLKLGDTSFRILQEPKEWEGYWEHSNYGHGFPFPCTGDRETCPGCTSDLETRKSAGRKILLQVVERAKDKDGNPKTDDKGKAVEYVNLYKVSREVADKLANRAERIGTITDRFYTLTRFKTGSKASDVATDIDSDGKDESLPPVSSYELIDHEEMLQKAYDDVWGDEPKDTSKLKVVKEDEEVPTPTSKEAEASTGASDSSASGPSDEVDPDDEVAKMRKRLAELEAANTYKEKDGSTQPNPPTEPEAKQDTEAKGEDEEDVVYTPEQLKAMNKAQLLALIIKEQEKGGLPENDKVKSMTKVELLDWLFAALSD